MKHSFFIHFLCAMFSSINASASVSTIDLEDIKLPPYPRILSYSPVLAAINETNMIISFEPSVGMATITVYDKLNQIIYQETVNADETPEVFIPSDNWVSSNYTLTITYVTTTLKGEFQIE